MKVGDIARYIERIAPISLAADWDNPGLVIGNLEREIQSVVVCLDVTRSVVDFAIQNKASLILSHHPFIFRGVKSINTKYEKGLLIERLIKNDICVYGAHTNFDFAQNGLNSRLSKKVGLHYENSLFWGNDKDRIIGKIGETSKPMMFPDFINDLKNKLNIHNVRVVGDMNRTINKVAVFCGAFDESVLKVIEGRVDCIVTGDLKHHTACGHSRK